MKQKFLIILLIIGITAFASAQRFEWNRGGLPAGEEVTLTGTLVITHGAPAIKSGDVTYIIPGINRFSSLVDGIKEGAQVTIEGMSINHPTDNSLKFVRASKLTYNGKSYDLSPPESARAFWGDPLPPRSSMRDNSMRHQRQYAPRGYPPHGCPQHGYAPHGRNAPNNRHLPPGRHAPPRRYPPGPHRR